jgi:hypothetical protein
VGFGWASLCSVPWSAALFSCIRRGSCRVAAGYMSAG